MSQSFSLTITIPKHTIPTIVGKGGISIAKLREEHGVQVKFHDSDEDGPDTLVESVIEGNRNGVLKTQKIIEDVVSEIVRVVLVTFLYSL